MARTWSQSSGEIAATWSSSLGDIAATWSQSLGEIAATWDYSVAQFFYISLDDKWEDIVSGYFSDDALSGEWEDLR